MAMKCAGGKTVAWAAMGTRVIAAALVLGLLSTSAIRAQPGPPLPRFEVASIKPNKSGEVRTSLMPYPEGRLTAENNSLKQLVRAAFGLRDFQISGGPGWFEADRFDIIGKAEGPASKEQLLQMLQSLLVDRFTLVFHAETKQLPVFDLVVAKRGRLGPAISPSAAGAGVASVYHILGPPGRMKGTRATMEELAASLSGTTHGRLVVDKTGLAGAYDFTLEWTPEQRLLPPGVPPEALEGAPNRPPSDGPSLSTALKEQLGLKLDSARGSVPIIVVESASRPSEN
jgi:uncharacterized protein (TIGR03435 family)